ncbi:hypothetical protein AB0P21_39810 [Kribbella sp. NPDC056861]|uniref:hypothetical protein n=1 Tax=Kribbella sp. NPDC056861 TaxID=3154857 RepID=UPI003416DC8A
MSYAREDAQDRLVRVWFGHNVIASYRAEPGLAARYAAAMERRFTGLAVTNEPLTVVRDETGNHSSKDS